MVIVYIKWKKHNEIQLTKNKRDLNNRKITNHPPSPVMNNITHNANQSTKAQVVNHYSGNQQRHLILAR